MDLENELNTELFIRGRRSITLTQSGILFLQRAQEMVSLWDKARRDITEHKGTVVGMVSIGCVETGASLLLPDVIEAFGALYPKVQYEIYSADGDDIRNKIDSGHADIGILLEPVEVAKYDFIPLPFYEVWGVLIRKDDALAKKKSVSIEDIAERPLFLSRRHIVSNEIESWFGERAKNFHVLAYNNFLTNMLPLIERGLGCAITVRGAHDIRPNEKICFVPFSPERKSGHVMAWKKNRIFNEAATLFIEYIKGMVGHTE